MENLNLEGSAKTPTVKFDSTNGVLELKGRSIPENSIEFYKPLNDWIDKLPEKFLRPSGSRERSNCEQRNDAVFKNLHGLG